MERPPSRGRRGQSAPAPVIADCVLRARALRRQWRDAFMQPKPGRGMTARPLGWSEERTGDRATRSRPIAWLVRSLKVATISVGLTAASIGAYWGAIQYQGNLHAVSDGILYRSAQLSKSELRSAAT